MATGCAEFIEDPVAAAIWAEFDRCRCYGAHSNDGGATWSEPVQCALRSGHDDPHLFYCTNPFDIERATCRYWDADESDLAREG